jgi:hypothetical protein
MGPGLPRARLQQVMADPAAKPHLQEFIQQSAAAASQEDTALLDWWGSWKLGVLHEVLISAREVRIREETSTVQARRQAALALITAYVAVEAATTPAASAAALQQVEAARQQWCAGVQRQAAAAEWQQRRAWVHNGERPNPHLTGLLNSEKGGPARQVPPMPSPFTGRVASGGRALAQLMAEFFGRVSAQPAVEQAAIGEVMAAVQGAGLRLNEAVADAVGCGGDRGGGA